MADAKEELLRREALVGSADRGPSGELQDQVGEAGGEIRKFMIVPMSLPALAAGLRACR